MKLKGLIKKNYFSNSPLTREDYEFSRKMFIYEGSAAVGIFSLTSGAFLAGFAKYLGATDEFNGLIGSIPSLAGVFQILSSLLFEKMKHRKFLIAILCFIFRMLLGIMIFVPIFVQNTTIRLVLLATIYGIAYSIAAFITPPASSWIVDLTPENIRGRYFARKDAVSLGFLTILTLALGKIMDMFRKSNNEYGGFIILALVVIVLTVMNFYFLSVVKEPTDHRKSTIFNLKTVIQMSLTHRGFRKIIIMSTLWGIALQIGGPFFAVYMVTGLKLSYSYIMVMGLISSIVRVISAKTWGDLADKRSWAFTTKLSIVILAVVHLTWGLVDSSSSSILVPLLHIIGGIAWAGLSISLFNIQFVYAPVEGRTAYLGVAAALGGLAGFASTYIGSIIVKLLKNLNFNFFGFSIGNMQIVFILSGLLLIATAGYVHIYMKQGLIE